MGKKGKKLIEWAKEQAAPEPVKEDMRQAFLKRKTKKTPIGSSHR